MFKVVSTATTTIKTHPNHPNNLKVSSQSPTMPTIFITGASGYIGTVLTTFAVSQGHTVHALSRTPISDTHLTSLGATPIRGDLSTHDVLTHEASAADITINIADSIAGQIGQITHEERFKINNAAILALAKGVEGTNKKLVLTSGSLFTGAHPEGKETDEASPVWRDSPFGLGMESSFELLKEKGVNVNVVRLAPWVYGRGGSGVKLFMSGAKAAGVMTYVDGGEKRTTTVHVDDAARLYLLVATKGKWGEIYNATAGTDVTFKQLAEAMGKTMGVEVRSVPYEVLEPKVGTFLAKFLCSENRASNAKATRDLGWTIEAEKGIFEEIESGSYVNLAQELRKSSA
jgi:nucleoside-diphosphate-sugar epimerase